MVGKTQGKYVLVTKKGQELFWGPEGKWKGKVHIHISFPLSFLPEWVELVHTSLLTQFLICDVSFELVPGLWLGNSSLV